MNEIIIGLLVVMATMAVGDSVRFENEIVENMLRGIGIFTVIYWAAIVASKIFLSEDKQEKKE